MLPGIFNQTRGRREVKRLTGNYWVPVLVTDDGTRRAGLGQDQGLGKANPRPAATPSAAVS